MQPSFMSGIVTGACVLGVCLTASAELSLKEFQYIMQTVRAPSDATWRTIPWKTSLLEAQRIAARERKPLFIWAMDGHPLGCT